MVDTRGERDPELRPAYLRKQNRVLIKVTSTSQGLRFRLAPEGVKIALEP